MWLFTLGNEVKTVCISGGFDPLHVGHLRMIIEASGLAQGGRLVVILNSDEWLMQKKGYVFMPFEERKEILMGIRGVSEVTSVDDSDNTVCEALIRINPKGFLSRSDRYVFANGGDRKEGNIPEAQVCNDLNIEMIYNVGGGKVQSSSKLVHGMKSRAENEWENEGVSNNEHYTV